MIIIYIFFIIILIYILLILSTIKISINNFESSNCDEIHKKEFSIIVSLHLFNKLRIFKKTFDNSKLEKIYNKAKLKQIDIKKMKNILPENINILKIIKKLNIKLSKLNMDLEIDTEDVLLTTWLVYIISTIISIILPRIIDEYKGEKYKYRVLPIYKNKNQYKIKLDCIINIKMVHIIYIVYFIIKGKENNKNERASNRRTYGYSYE